MTNAIYRYRNFSITVIIERIRLWKEISVHPDSINECTLISFHNTSQWTMKSCSLEG